MENRTKKRPEKPFSVFLFALTIILTLTVYDVLLEKIAPNVRDVALQAPLWKLGIVFFVAHFFFGIAEFFFHRYMLHSPFPGLGRLYRQHNLHHGLTNITLIGVRDNRGKVFSHYPILEEKQHEASYFPWYALGVFLVAFLPAIIFFQWLFPSWPIVFGTPLALAFSLSLYEIVHAIEHWSFATFWKPRVFHPTFGKFWTWFYCFHLRHHANVMTNENISGFLATPVADVLFGTYAPWSRVFLHGEHVPESEFRANPPKPCWLIRFLDSKLLSPQTSPS